MPYNMALTRYLTVAKLYHSAEGVVWCMCIWEVGVYQKVHKHTPQMMLFSLSVYSLRRVCSLSLSSTCHVQRHKICIEQIAGYQLITL